MYRYLIILLGVYAVGCTPKLVTQTSSNDYSEDVSAFRPKVEAKGREPVEETVVVKSKGSYVPPTHDINGEMNAIMDSIVVQNQDKLYLTYTIRVYLGRSREEANQIREQVYRALPEEKPMLIYKQPSYKVNVGKYFDRVEAYKTLTMLRGSFPGALIVPERNSMEN